MRIKLLRRRAGLTNTPWFQCRELILVFVCFTPVVGFRPQMTFGLHFRNGTDKATSFRVSISRRDSLTRI